MSHFSFTLLLTVGYCLEVILKHKEQVYYCIVKISNNHGHSWNLISDEYICITNAIAIVIRSLTVIFFMPFNFIKVQCNQVWLRQWYQLRVNWSSRYNVLCSVVIDNGIMVRENFEHQNICRPVLLYFTIIITCLKTLLLSAIGW